MYDFKLLPEAARAAGFAVIVFVLTTIAAFDVKELADWKPWAISVATGAIGAAAAAALGILTRARSKPTPPPPRPVR